MSGNRDVVGRVVRVSVVNRYCGAGIALLVAAVIAPSLGAQGTAPSIAPSTSNQATVHAEFQRRGVVGYADRLSVQPGETIKFMVSSELPTYQADIVELIHGDANVNGPGLKTVDVATSISKQYTGRRQVLPFGSYVEVPDAAALRMTGSFTLAGWLAPSTPGRTGGAAAASGVLTKWSDAAGTGYGLMIDERGHLALWIGAGDGKVAKIATDVPMRAWTAALPGAANPRPQHVPTIWYFVAAVFDASTGSVTLYQQPANRFPGDATRTSRTVTTDLRSIAPNDAPLVMGAYSTARPGVSSGPGYAPPFAGYLNGKLGAPQVYNRALSSAEISALQEGKAPTGVVAAWDLAREVATRRVVDTSSNKLDGRTVNFPYRAVTGHNWTGAEFDYRRAPEQYNAIKFHDDDLEDARWEVGFELSVPDTLPSGIYAARLRTTTSEDFVPFFVRPKKDGPKAKIAFLVPTFSYVAYAGAGASGFRPLSMYAHHNDGSGVGYSSHLRPITNMRPKIPTHNPWQFMADTHIVDWLHAKQFDVDIITDHDLHAEGQALLDPYNVVISGTHPEYYSGEMLDAVENYMYDGGRFMYMGGNGFYWVTTPDPEGRYLEVRRRDGTEAWQGAPGEGHHSTTGESGGLWRFRGRAPQSIVAVGFTAQGFDRNSPFKRMPGGLDPRASFIFEGIEKDELIGNHPSLVLYFGAGGSELDRVDYALGSPAHTLILARSFGHSDAYHHVVEELNTSNSQQHGPVNSLVYADLAYAEFPNGGAVFSTGSIAWSGSLSFNNYTNNVSKLTENVLRRFAADEPIPFPVNAGLPAR